MSVNEAQEYVDLVVETLHEWNIITVNTYGKMTEVQRQKLAEMVAEKSEE